MTQEGKGNKWMSLLEKKDVANIARSTIRREGEESNCMVSSNATASFFLEASTTLQQLLMCYICRSCSLILDINWLKIELINVNY
jgi:hypothetical protein